MLGTDKQLDDSWRVGMATGYTRSDLDAMIVARMPPPAYHLAAYLNSQFDALAVPRRDVQLATSRPNATSASAATTIV